jgi:aspartate/methionine/tyrosine aminotransferase
MLQDGLYGSNPVREALAARYRVPADEVFPTEGTSLANFLAMAALLDGGGHAVVETPVYTPFLQQVEALADTVELVERPFEDGFVLDPERLERALRPDTRLVALTNLHNPSGVRMPDTLLTELAGRAARVGAHLLVDEVYRDFLYDEEPGTARTLAANVVITSSLTKVYGLGNLRFGWLIGPRHIVHRASRINDYLGVLQPSPAISLGLRALTQLDALAARSRRAVEAAMPALREWIRSRHDLEVVWPEAGAIVFPRLTGAAAGIDTDALSQRLMARERVSVVPGRFFRAPEAIRLAATVTPEVLRDGLNRLGEAIDVMSRGG